MLWIRFESLMFQLEHMFRSYLNFSTFYGRSTDLKSFLGLLLVSFIWLGEKISLQYLLIGWVDVCPPHVQMVSTSLMSKPVIANSTCMTCKKLVKRLNQCTVFFQEVCSFMHIFLSMLEYWIPILCI